MKNKFEHLENDITKIFVGSKKSTLNNLSVALISTIDFEKVDDATSEYWSLWDNKTNYGITTNIDGKYVKMSRFIMDVQNNRKKFVVHANENFLDLRRENLMVADPGELFTDEFKEARKEIVRKLMSFSKVLNNIDLFEEENKVEEKIKKQTTLYIEKNMINNQISFTINDNKRILKSLTEEDTKVLIEIFRELDVKIE